MQLPEGACDWLACRKLVVATDLVATIAGKLKLDDASSLTPLATASGAALEGCRYRHPLFERESPLVIGGDYITTDAGTGLVHTAPGHGQEDYLVGLRCGLDVLSPVDDAGVFTAEAGQFEGQAVLGEGNAAVIEALKGAGALLRLEDYRHKYPYDWRTKKPTIFRATDQWFASVDGFKAAALAAIEEVTWMPSVGKNRIRAMTDGRCARPAAVWRAANTALALRRARNTRCCTQVGLVHLAAARVGRAHSRVLRQGDARAAYDARDDRARARDRGAVRL